jgi:hypothetical protein
VLKKKKKEKEKMSVVPLSSPLSLSGNNVDVKYENDFSSVSPLLLDYKLLNSIIDSNQFEKSLELYSLMLNSSLNNEQKISFEIFINQFVEEYSSKIFLNEFKELIEIFKNFNIHSLISSYDLILQQYNQTSSNDVKFNLSDDENSLKKDHVS